MKLDLVRKLPATLWSALVMELFERLAYYGMLLVLGIYVVQELGVRSDVYGGISSFFNGASYLLPLFAGALAERYGYKPALIVAFAALAGGYFLVGAANSLVGIWLALGLAAIGGAIIKPVISGTVTRTTEEGSTRAVGFGLYYVMINAGGLLGPVIASQVRNRAAFHYVFWISAAACAAMLIPAIFAFKEPVTAAERRSGKTLGRVFGEIFLVLGNWRFVLLLVIFSGFWGMMNVLFSFLPLYVEQFSDLPAAEAAIDRVVPLTHWFGRWLNPEILVSLAALLIVLLQAPVSYLTRRWSTVAAMLTGCAVASCGWIIFALSPAAGVIACGIVVWALGEMICSARFFEYCGTIAPKDQIAVYLGYSFFSIFIGNTYSGWFAGVLYRRFIEAPVQAGQTPTPAAFFGSVLAMGLASVVGMALYARYAAPRRESA
ncbi:MAG: MFS transporter [Acidobacteria bacterium]|nr:MFS transporter [Acidobacteriota bacterium]